MSGIVSLKPLAMFPSLIKQGPFIFSNDFFIFWLNEEPIGFTDSSL